MNVRFRLTVVLTLGCLGFGGARGEAQVVMPPFNLGVSSLMDGLSGPGTLLEPVQLEYYTANRFVDSEGHRIPGDNSLRTSTNLFHFAHATTIRVLGGFYGVGLLVPIAKVELRTDFGPRGDSSGVGDLIVSPFMLHWPDRRLFGKPYFSRFALFTVLPTGKYDARSPVNVGSNVYSVFSYYALTWFFAPKWETSWRFHYVWNSKNTDPFVGLHASSTQPGQAFHFNAATSYEVARQFRAGVAGYFLQQTTDHRIDDRSIPNSRERVLALGPSVMFEGKGWNAFANAYVETAVQNRAEGSRFELRFQKIFGP